MTGEPILIDFGYGVRLTTILRPPPTEAERQRRRRASERAKTRRQQDRARQWAEKVRQAVEAGKEPPQPRTYVSRPPPPRSSILPLTPLAWAELGVALTFAAEGRADVAEAVLVDLETKLGVTVGDRVKAWGRPDVPGAVDAEARLRAERRRQRQAQHEQRARATNLITDHHVPPSEAALSAADRSLFKLAEAAKAWEAGDRRTTAAKDKEARRLALEASTERKRQLETLDHHAAAADRSLIAEARGETLISEDVEMKVPVTIEVAGAPVVVERLQRVTRIRNVSRDGLATLREIRKRQEAADRLWRIGKGPKPEGPRLGITDLQYKAGLRYRAMYEADAGGLGSQFKAILSAGRRFQREQPIEELVVPKALANRCDNHDALVELERAVRDSDPTGRRLYMLRAVAGEGRNIRELANGGAPRSRATLALIQALDVVLDHLRQPRP